MFSRLAPLVRNNMHLRYIVNPIAGFTSAVDGHPSSRCFRKSKALVPITAGAALGASYAGLAEAAAPRPRRRRDGARRSLLAQRLCARHQSRARQGRAAQLPRRPLVRHRHPRFGAVHALAARQGARSRSARPSTRTCSTCCRPPASAVLWLDNQSGCKDVCDRVPTQSTADLARPTSRPRCAAAASASTTRSSSASTSASRRLPEERRKKGVVLVMHQMGSHGPAYYKRSAPALKRFLPECTNTTLGQCDHAAAHQRVRQHDRRDRSLPRRDDRLAEGRSGDYAAALVYMSDHGESLGELGIFLHGLPYAFAPEAQKRVPFIAWFGADAGGAARPRPRRASAGWLDTPLQPRQPLSQRARPRST